MTNVEKFENLPFHESRKESITRKYGDMWDIYKFDHKDYRSDKSDYSWIKAERVIKKFMGKPFADAFSYYCTLVPIYEQDNFLRLFRPSRGWHHYYKPDYLINQDGNIIDNADPKKKKLILYQSNDYAIEMRHKITGNLYKISQWRRHKGEYYNNIEDYKPIVVSGFFQYFESKFDPRYVKLITEDNKRKAKCKRENKKLKVTKAYCFLTDDELQKKKDCVEGIIIRDRHGFDKNSFIGQQYKIKDK